MVPETQIEILTVMDAVVPETQIEILKVTDADKRLQKVAESKR